MCLGRKMPRRFFKKERIVRHIYSPYSFNEKTNELRHCFLNFVFQEENQKNELSCNRLEMETLSHCREVGEHHAQPTSKRNYYGFACTSVDLVTKTPLYSLLYSPTDKKGILNYSHSDIYYNIAPIPKGEKGEALAAKLSHDKEIFLKDWLPYIDREDLIKKKYITPKAS